MSFHVKYTQTKNDVIYLQSFDNTYLAITLLFYLILARMSWLQPRKGGLHFILSDNGNYDFDIKVRRCEFVGFINDLIDCRCLECVFFFFSHYFNSIIIMNMYVQFIIVVFMMNSLLIKFYKNYATIHIQILLNHLT